MLQLHHNDYQLSTLLPSTQHRLDSDTIRRATASCTINRVHISIKDIADALMPFFFKGIKLQSKYAELSTQETEGDFTFEESTKAVLDLMLELAASYLQTDITKNDVAFFRIYTDDIGPVTSVLESDTYKDVLQPVPDTIQTIYNKVSTDTKDRDGYNTETWAYYNMERHLMLLVSNYDDYVQASDTYLTIGLLPVLFPHVKELLDEEEIDYCKAFVRRAQIKRITNTFITDAFNVCTGTNKYRQILDDLKYNKILEDINYIFTNNVQNQIASQRDRVQQYLQEYERAYESYLNLQKQVRERIDNKEKVMEEVKLALKTEGVVEFELVNNRTALALTIKVPLIFYAQDEASLVVNRMRDGIAKRLYKAVFVDNKYTLWIINRFHFKLMSGNNEPPRFTRPGEVPLNVMTEHKGLFNPHTHFYQCIGDYEPNLIKTQAEGDLLGFVNLALASSKSLNFRDGAVINRFTDYLDDMDVAEGNDWTQYQLSLVPCLEDEDGNLISIKDAFITPNQTPVEVDVLDTLDEEDDL